MADLLLAIDFPLFFGQGFKSPIIDCFGDCRSSPPPGNTTTNAANNPSNGSCERNYYNFLWSRSLWPDLSSDNSQICSCFDACASSNTSPDNGCSPTANLPSDFPWLIFSMVDLPAPFFPTKAMRSLLLMT